MRAASWQPPESADLPELCDIACSSQGEPACGSSGHEELQEDEWQDPLDDECRTFGARKEWDDDAETS